MFLFLLQESLGLGGFQMTDTEKRRMELLEHTRKLYSDKNSPPAIHPRFQSTYQSLYKSEQKEEVTETSTFGIRLVIAILIFCLFVAAKQTDIDTEMVVKEIGQEYQSFVDLPIFD